MLQLLSLLVYISRLDCTHIDMEEVIHFLWFVFLSVTLGIDGYLLNIQNVYTRNTLGVLTNLCCVPIKINGAIHIHIIEMTYFFIEN